MGDSIPARATVLAALMLFITIPVRAAGPAGDPHVRPLVPGVDRFLAEGVSRSATIRSLVDRLEHSDLVVYVRQLPFNSSLTTGHMQFIGATPGRRYVMIEIACGESWNMQLATLGHELRHAVEVADAPWVRSNDDLAAHYARIGTVSGFVQHRESFETAAAVDAGRQVGRELFSGASSKDALISRNFR
jgi:hypothetical protein